MPSNAGNWPNLIRFDRVDTNAVVQGQSTSVKFYYQWAQPGTNVAKVSIFLDEDRNPLNANASLLAQTLVPGNGAASVSYQILSVTLTASNATPGLHAMYAKITGGGATRYLYAPELVQVISIQQPPTLDITRLSAGQFYIGVNGVPGQTIELQSSADLINWRPLITNSLSAARWTVTNNFTGAGQAFFRAVLER